MLMLFNDEGKNSLPNFLWSLIDLFFLVIQKLDNCILLFRHFFVFSMMIIKLKTKLKILKLKKFFP